MDLPGHSRTIVGCQNIQGSFLSHGLEREVKETSEASNM